MTLEEFWDQEDGAGRLNDAYIMKPFARFITIPLFNNGVGYGVVEERDGGKARGRYT